jgi:hypothetical protein
MTGIWSRCAWHLVASLRCFYTPVSHRQSCRGLQSGEESDASSSDESDEELPYGGDMQRAVQAQDRDAIRTLMAARKKGDGSKKVRACSAAGRAAPFWSAARTERTRLRLLQQRKPRKRQLAGEGQTEAAVAASSSGAEDGRGSPSSPDGGGAPVYSRGGAAATALLVGAAVWAGMTALQKWRAQVRRRQEPLHAGRSAVLVCHEIAARAVSGRRGTVAVCCSCRGLRRQRPLTVAPATLPLAAARPRR